MLYFMNTSAIACRWAYGIKQVANFNSDGVLFSVGGLFAAPDEENKDSDESYDDEKINDVSTCGSDDYCNPELQYVIRTVPKDPSDLTQTNTQYISVTQCHRTFLHNSSNPTNRCSSFRKERGN